MQKKYKLKIEGENYEWENQFITEQEIRTLGPGIPEGMDIFMKTQGSSGRLIEAGEKIDLSEPGIEKFYAQESKSDAGI
jgi:hypothetical protein